jgi:hypothetical protein
MTTTARRPAARKIARIKSRCVVDERTVVYTVLSSDGTQDYETTFRDGKFVGCTCPARIKWCYHGLQLQAREDALATEEPKPMLVHVPPIAVWHRPTEVSQKGMLNGASQGFSLLRR